MAVTEENKVEQVEERVGRSKELIENLDSDFRFHPLYGAAMLKVSFELRPGAKPGFTEILKNTLSGIQAGEEELDEFIRLHRSCLERRCKEVGI